MSLPLTKLANIQSDLTLLESELQRVNRYFTDADPQHESRKWEYAMALRAMNEWRTAVSRDLDDGIYDVGGFGSPFQYMSKGVTVVDPRAPDGYTLEQFVGPGTELAAVVTCLSVLEHVDDLDHFCYLLGCLVAPGGLLFLTMDHGTDLPDEYHFHWDRKRIFDTKAWETLREKFGEFTLFGGRDRTYHGNQVYDFSIASLAMVKRA